MFVYSSTYNSSCEACTQEKRRKSQVRHQYISFSVVPVPAVAVLVVETPIFVRVKSRGTWYHHTVLWVGRAGLWGHANTEKAVFYYGLCP